MYQIKHITDKEGVAKAEAADRAHLGCIGDAKMELRQPGGALQPVYPYQPGPELEKGAGIRPDHGGDHEQHLLHGSSEGIGVCYPFVTNMIQKVGLLLAAGVVY